MSTVGVTVKVYENGAEIATKTIRYFEGQQYAVKIDTPDGTDVEAHFTAGNGGEDYK